MQTQELAHLKTALQLTFGPNQESVNAGEQQLKQAQQLPNFAISLLMITDDANNPEQIRQSAVVNLKTFLENHWAHRPNEPNRVVISDQEKEIIKSSIIDALARCVEVKKLRSQYEDIIYKLVAIDYPQQWQTLVQQIVQRLSNYQNYQSLWSTLVTLRRTAEVHQFLLDENRKPLEPLVSSTFPILEQLMQKLLEAYNEHSGQLVKIILKIFHHSFHLTMPYYLKDYGVLQRWMLFFKTIIQAPVPPELSTLTVDSDEETRREKTYQWANKKWASRIVLRFIQKYANHKLVEKDMKEFADHVKQNYAAPFMEIFYAILCDKVNFQGPRCCLFGLKYLFYALRLDITQALLKPHLDKLLYAIAIPKMQLTPRDDKLWKEDPEEYIKRLEDFSLSSYNMKNPANDLLQEVCKQQDANGNQMLLHFLQHCQACFATHIDPFTNQPLDVLKKEALLWGIESLSTEILKIEQIQDTMEQILEKFIIPEFQNPVGFLRSRACSVFSEYGTINFNNKNNIAAAVGGISCCIMDKELPVRVSAAIAFSSILQHKEAQDLIRPKLNLVLEIYIKLMDLIDNEKIVRSLEDIVKNFTAEITPYAHQLAEHIAKIFEKYCRKQNQGQDDSDDDGEAEMAASGCLEAIKRILNAKLSSECYLQMEGILFPIINFALTESGCDFINEALEILNLLLYKRNCPITPGLWFYYPVLCYIITGLPAEANVYSIPGLSEEQYQLLDGCKKDWGSEFVGQMLGSFRNYIQKGKELFLTSNDLFGRSFVSLFFNVIQKVYSVSQNGNDDTDENQVTTLLVTLIENTQGMIDGIIPQILDFTLSNFQKPKKTNRFKMINIGVLCMCIWYNAGMAVAILDSKGLTDQLLSSLIQMEKHYKYEWDVNRLFFAICSLYTLQKPPNYLILNCADVGKFLMRMTTRMLEMREEDESCEAEDQAEVDHDEYKKVMSKMNNQELDLDDEDEDEDDQDYDEGDDYADLYDSPLEDLDAILLYEKLILSLQQTNPPLYQGLLSGLTKEDQEKLGQNIKEAKSQYEAWLKQKEQAQ